MFFGGFDLNASTTTGFDSLPFLPDPAKFVFKLRRDGLLFQFEQPPPHSEDRIVRLARLKKKAPANHTAARVGGHLADHPALGPYLRLRLCPVTRRRLLIVPQIISGPRPQLVLNLSVQFIPQRVVLTGRLRELLLLNRYILRTGLTANNRPAVGEGSRELANTPYNE